MSLANYAQKCITYLSRNKGEHALPDPRGAAFRGGVLLDLGNNERVAFFLPVEGMTQAEQTAVHDELVAHLDNIYPSGYDLGPVWRDLEAGVTYAKVEVAEASLPLAG